MTRMIVKHMKPSPNGGDAILVLQTGNGDRYLGFFVPMNEANRLARVLGMSGCRCSPIYDLLLALGTAAATRIERAVLDATPDGVGAILVFQHQDGDITIECHPADAVPLAVRVRAPIYATQASMVHAGRAAAHPELVEDASRWLATVRPADFGRPGANA
ncbi:MAG: bifunctional nuclease domain-containing protein [Candidatus Rokuibacteriota bacterium]